MAIIVISHQMGAGGPELGMALSKRLGYRYVDQELLQDAVRRYGLAEDKLSHLDESKPTFFERFDTETRHHITVLQTTLLELAELDNCVFMRGGGQWLLRGVPHVLRMRVIAPFEHRVKHLVKRAAAMGETFTQRNAAEAVRRDDLEKAGRMRYLYEVDISDPMLYELIVNTEMLKLRRGGRDDRDADAPPRDRHHRDGPRGDRLARAGLASPGGARHAPRDPAIPDHGGGARRASSRWKERRPSSARSRWLAACRACATSGPSRSRSRRFHRSWPRDMGGPNGPPIRPHAPRPGKPVALRECAVRYGAPTRAPTPPHRSRAPGHAVALR